MNTLHEADGALRGGRHLPSPVRRSARLAAALVATSLVLSGCAAASASKSGTPSLTTVRVAFTGADANANGQAYGGPAFLASLTGLFGDQLDLVVDARSDEARGGDVGVVNDVKAGQVDVGWVPTRMLSEAGIKGFDALAAPMTVVNQEAMAAIVQGETSAAFLDQTQGSEVTALALASGSLRRPVATEPLLAPQDWEGVDVAVLARSQTPAIEALGGRPVATSTSLQAAAAGREVTAGEGDVPDFAQNDMSATPYITGNVVLWPKVWVFLANTAWLESLSDEQQGWVREAALRATQASVAGSHDETAAALDLCTRGVRFPEVTPDEYRALQAALAPTIEQLSSDPVDGPLLARVQAEAAAHPGVVDLGLDEHCVSSPASTGSGSPVGVPTTASDVPPGTYRTLVSKDDLLAGGETEAVAEDVDTVLTVVLSPDGSYRVISDDIDPPDASFNNVTVEAGSFTGEGSRLYLSPSVERLRELKAQGVKVAVDSPNSIPWAEPYSFTWKVVGDDLVFSDTVGREGWVVTAIEAHRWQRIR